MAKATEIHKDDVFYKWAIFCPGCECAHTMDSRWTFNRDFEKPTFHPSLHIKNECHSWVRDGRIQFLNDCSHRLAGKTVDLPDEFY